MRSRNLKAFRFFTPEQKSWLIRLRPPAGEFWRSLRSDQPPLPRATALMKPCRGFISMAVIIGAILLSARRPANNKRNVEPRGRNDHFVFTRSTRFRPKPGAIVGADRQQSGGRRQIGRAVRVADTGPRANHRFVRRGRSSGSDRASEKQFHK